MTTAPAHSTEPAVRRAEIAKWPVMLAALGVVYGDIGTSPLYAMKECFSPSAAHHVTATGCGFMQSRTCRVCCSNAPRTA